MSSARLDDGDDAAEARCLRQLKYDGNSRFQRLSKFPTDISRTETNRPPPPFAVLASTPTLPCTARTCALSAASSSATHSPPSLQTAGCTTNQSAPGTPQK